jgi:hypothetical protein
VSVATRASDSGASRAGGPPTRGEGLTCKHPGNGRRKRESRGRILWSTTSDFLGRKNMYRIYLGVGALLYLTLTFTTNSNKVVFLLLAIVLLSFYGAGFATVPAYPRDLFGTYQVGAIHGRLLTAWSTAH